jgi:hypothetical protein
MDMGHLVEREMAKKNEVPGENVPSVTLYNTNPTSNHLGLNSYRCDEQQMNNRLISDKGNIEA